MEQGIFYAKKLNAPLVFATDGVFCKSFHTYGNRTPLLNGNEVDEFIREAIALKYLNNWEVNTISPKVQYDRKELIKIFDEANNMLRGDGLRAGIERFSEFANILFLKLISETYKDKISYSCRWETIKAIPPVSRIEYINNIVYKELNLLYETEIFTPLSLRDPDILRDIMNKLDPLNLTDIDSDIKGDAFEYFLKASTASGNDLGEYFTPRHIVKTMVRFVNPQIGEKIYDPFCGTGGFLIEAFRYIYNNMARTNSNLDVLREHTVYGNEITNTARITKMNMILAGDGHSNVKMKDSLANPVDGKYDIVLANMPYSQKTKYGNLYDLPSNNGDSICVQHCIKAINSLSPNGRMAIVVPEGFLFRKDLSNTRKYLLDNCELQSIISLPQGVFLPYTSVKTDIIFATKVNRKIPASEKKKNFWYFDVKSDGFTLDNYRRKIDAPSGISKYEEYRKLDAEQTDEMTQVGFENIPLQKVQDNNFVLSGNKYRDVTRIDSKYKLVKLSDILEYEQPTKYIVINTNYNSKYSTPVLTAGKSFILGYTNEKEGIYSTPLPVIIFDDFTTATQFVDFRFKVKSSALKILKVNDSKADAKYVYYAMKELSIDNSIHKRYWIDEYSKLEIPLPSIETQLSVVKVLDNYRNIINGAQEVINNYHPSIQIDTNWKSQKLSLVFKTSSGGTPLTSIDEYYLHGDIPWVNSSELAKGKIYSTDKHITQKGLDNSSAKIFPKHTVLIAMYGATIGQVGILEIEAATNQAICAIIPNKEINPYYLYYYLKMQKDYLVNLSVGGAQPNISQEIIKNLIIQFPSLSEQNIIVNKIENELNLINNNNKVVEIFTEKMKQKILELYKV